MATEFTTLIQDRPGALADLTEALAKGGVNIIAIHATPCPDEAIVQFITNNNEATVEALKVAGIDYTAREVLLLSIAHEPGSLARLTRAIATAGVNIDALYLTNSGQIVLQADNLRAAQKAALELGIM